MILALLRMRRSEINLLLSVDFDAFALSISSITLSIDAVDAFVVNFDVSIKEIIRTKNGRQCVAKMCGFRLCDAFRVNRRRPSPCRCCHRVRCK